MSTSRAEAFSDGVFAIAITLLVLEIDVPEPGSGGLGHELLAQWPSYAAYVVSFLTIGIIWINHHAMFRRLRVVDHSTLVWNLLLLMSVGVLPFTTALMAAYLKESDGEGLAAAIYSGSFLVMSIFFAATNRHILFSRSGLLEESVDDKTRREALSRGVVGLLPYLLATVLAFVFYALPFASATASVTSDSATPGD